MSYECREHDRESMQRETERARPREPEHPARCAFIVFPYLQFFPRFIFNLLSESLSLHSVSLSVLSRVPHVSPGSC